MEFRFNQTLTLLQDALKLAGIPITGISPRQPATGEATHFTDKGQGFFVEIHFAESATIQQRAEAASILASFRFEPRKARGQADLSAAINQLTGQQRNLILTRMIADAITADPNYALRLGIDLVGDESETKPENKAK